jgi:hypothetical protein
MIYVSHRESLPPPPRFEPFVHKLFSRGKTVRDRPSSAQASTSPFRSFFKVSHSICQNFIPLPILCDCRSLFGGTPCFVLYSSQHYVVQIVRYRQWPQALRFATADGSIFHSVYHPYEPTFSVWGFHERDAFTTRFV